MNSPYYTDPEVRTKIDEILQKSSRIYSNLGTSTIFDLKSIDQAKTQEKQWLKEIEALDPIFYQKVVSQG